MKKIVIVLFIALTLFGCIANNSLKRHEFQYYVTECIVKKYPVLIMRDLINDEDIAVVPSKSKSLFTSSIIPFEEHVCVDFDKQKLSIKMYKANFLSDTNVTIDIDTMKVETYYYEYQDKKIKMYFSRNLLYIQNNFFISKKLINSDIIPDNEVQPLH